MDYWQEIENLLVKHRASEARRHLNQAGPLAVPAIRRALVHDNPYIRWFACGFLDHFLDEASLTDLVERLEDPEPSVRGRALHSLACERCKEGECRPNEEMFLPTVLRMLEQDPSPGVRTEAVNLLFQIVHRSAPAGEALVRAKEDDPDGRVRAKAAMCAPGGVMWMRTSPNPTDRRGLKTSSPRKRLVVR